MPVGTRRRIQLVKAVNVKAASGVWGQAVRTRYNYWAEVENLSGSRNYQNSQTKTSNAYRFRIRHNEAFDLSADWSVIYAGKRLTVTSIVREKEKDFYWTIEANG
jgi:SPP1 family predicted phage head-tail adaptor